MINVLNQILNKEFEGFDDMYCTWSNYNCGMGICCDPYAVGFTLPKYDFDDHMFKLVDGENYDNNGNYPDELSEELPEPCYESPDLKEPRLNVIVFYQEFAEEIEKYLGLPHNWENELLHLLNKKFGLHAKKIICQKNNSYLI